MASKIIGGFLIAAFLIPLFSAIGIVLWQETDWRGWLGVTVFFGFFLGLKLIED